MLIICDYRSFTAESLPPNMAIFSTKFTSKQMYACRSIKINATITSIQIIYVMHLIKSEFLSLVLRTKLVFLFCMYS